MGASERQCDHDHRAGVGACCSVLCRARYQKLPDTDTSYENHLLEEKAFARWVQRNVRPHKVAGYASVTLSLKPGISSPPGDASDVQMDAAADLADEFSFSELRVSHEQNLILADVRKRDLHALWLR